MGTLGLGDTLGYPRLGTLPRSPGGIPWGDCNFPNEGSFGVAQTLEYAVRLRGDPHGYTLLPPKPRTMFVEGVFSLGCYDNAFSLDIALRAYFSYYHLP